MEKRTLARFEDKILRTASCWLWLAATNSDGYGSFRFEGKVQGAHRVSWILFRGAVPKGESVLHSCDVRHCVRPDHLFLGSQGDNMQDAVTKGRLSGRNTPRGNCHGARTCPASVRRGADNGAAALTDEQVALIRSADASQRELAKRFNVSQRTVGRVLRGATYK